MLHFLLPDHTPLASPLLALVLVMPVIANVGGLSVGYHGNMKRHPLSSLRNSQKKPSESYITDIAKDVGIPPPSEVANKNYYKDHAAGLQLNMKTMHEAFPTKSHLIGLENAFSLITCDVDQT